MPSHAFADLGNRLAEIDLLLEAHEALIKFHRAEQAIAGTGVANLQQAVQYLQNLVQDVGRGRPPEVQAVSKGAIALLSAHLQGYLVDLHQECAHLLLNEHIASVNALVNQAPTRGNPNADNIGRLFATLGFRGVLDGIHWRNMSNSSVKARLQKINELRNRIVHGAPETVHKVQVTNNLNFVRRFTQKFDTQMTVSMTKVLGRAPW